MIFHSYVNVYQRVIHNNSYSFSKSSCSPYIFPIRHVSIHITNRGRSLVRRRPLALSALQAVTWGEPFCGGDSSAVQPELEVPTESGHRRWHFLMKKSGHQWETIWRFNDFTRFYGGLMGSNGISYDLPFGKHLQQTMENGAFSIGQSTHYK